MVKPLVVLVFCGTIILGLAFVEVPGFGSPWQWVTTRSFSAERVEQSKVIASDVIAALERFHEAEGAYPDELSDLVPHHLDRIPLPTAGCREWGYQLEGEGFVLRFYRPGEYPVAWYRSSKQIWCIDD